jgi:hypothetical protein
MSSRVYKQFPLGAYYLAWLKERIAMTVPIHRREESKRVSPYKTVKWIERPDKRLTLRQGLFRHFSYTGPQKILKSE